MKQLSLFDHLKNLTVNKTPWNEDDEVMKKYSQFMVNKFVSMDDRFIDITTTLNNMPNLPDKIHYEMLLLYLPKVNIFFNYINKDKKKQELDRVKVVSLYYRIPMSEAESTLKMLPAETVDELLELYVKGEVFDV
jgi:hypothetical protein